MKEIRMDFETYEGEMQRAAWRGENEVLLKVAAWIKSGMPWDKWAWDNLGEICYDYFWYQVLKSMGRENECPSAKGRGVE